MTPRPQPLPPPPEQSHRYWTVDLNEEGAKPDIHRGPFLFRFPSYGVASKALHDYLEVFERLSPDETEVVHAGEATAPQPVISTAARLEMQERAHARLIAICWRHRVFDLGVPTLRASDDEDAWEEMTDMALEALLDGGLTYADLTILASECLDQCLRRLNALAPVASEEAPAEGNADAPEEGDGSETPSPSTSD